MRVGNRGATFERNLTQAPPADCPGEETAGDRAQRDQFRVTISPSYVADETLRASISVSWQRPTDDCGSADSSRSVELSGSVTFADDTPITLQGGGGLTVRLTRR